MKKWFMALAILASGCSAYREQEAIFVGYNTSNDNVVVLVNDGAETPIVANRSIQFVVQILVPNNPVNTVNGPSSIDKQVQVSIAFRNLRTGRLTSPIFCNAGAKVITTVWYRVDSSGSGYADCNSSYGY